MKLMHHQELHQEHQAHLKSVVCYPHNVTLPHEQLHGFLHQE